MVQADLIGLHRYAAALRSRQLLPLAQRAGRGILRLREVEQALALRMRLEALVAARAASASLAVFKLLHGYANALAGSVAMKHGGWRGFVPLLVCTR